MLDRLPDTLFRTKRGLCPCCGSPLPLGEDTSHIECGYCGQRAVLERRLRRAEPEVPGAPLRQFDARDHEGWTRTDRLAEAYLREAACPGCGQGLDEPEHGSRVACGSCGMECHIERRLVPPAEHPLRRVPRARHPDEQRVYDLEDDDDPEAEHLIFRLVNEADPDRAMDLSLWLGRWTLINETTARLMPALLERMARGDAPLAYQVTNAVGKCLCSDVAIARETVRAMEAWIVRVPADRQLISALGLGKAIGLKLLLDSATMAHKAGDLEQSVAACFAINWMLQRNYDEHPIISRILLHRMFYLSGPPLAFCVMFIHGQVSDVAFRYDSKTMLAFLDDAVVERPCLVPSLDHPRGFWGADAANEAEWGERLTFVETLRSDGARLAGWRHYLDAPKEASAPFLEAYVGRLVPMLDHESEAWREFGARRLEAVVRRGKPTPEGVMRQVRERGEALPVRVRRAILNDHPECGLSRENLPSWNADPEATEHPEIVEARRLYREGLDAMLARRKDDRAASKAYWEARGGAPRDLVKIFDGSCEAPAPQRRPGPRRAAPRPWEDPADGADGAPDPEPDVEEPETETDLPGEPEPSQPVEAPEPPPGQPVAQTLWEFVATLPPDQQKQYEPILRQMEPQRAAIEAAVRAARGEAPIAPEPPPPPKRRLFGRPKG